MVFKSIVEGDGFGFTTAVQVDQDFVMSEFPRYAIGIFFWNKMQQVTWSQSNIYKHREKQNKLPLLPSRELVRKTRWREGGFQCRERCCWSSSSKIEKNVSLDHTRNCISTSNKNKKIRVRIHSTVKVIRACMFIMWSVLEVAQRVPPTCI